MNVTGGGDELRLEGVAVRQRAKDVVASPPVAIVAKSNVVDNGLRPRVVELKALAVSA